MTVITRRAPSSSLHGLRVALGLGVALLLALIIAIGMLLATGSAPPPLVIAPQNGLIAYSFEDDIWVSDADGTSPRVLVGGETVDVGPWWSRDGTRLLFVRVVQGGEHLVSVDASGGDLRVLTADPLTVMTWFDWSPDGRSIVISWDADRDGSASLGLVAADGSGVTPLETGMASSAPSFHPDGSRILFRGVSAAGVPGLYTIPASGGEVSGPFVTSDTTTSAYAQFRGEYDLLDPAWSPGGSRIAFVRLEDGLGADIDATPWRLHVVNADGTDPRRLEVSAESDDEWLPSWSPDGRHIALQVLDADPTLRRSGRRAAHVAIVSPDGTEQPSLLGPIAFLNNPGNPNATDFLWSPDSTRMLVSEAGQRTELRDVAARTATVLSWEATGGWSWQPVVRR